MTEKYTPLYRTEITFQQAAEWSFRCLVRALSELLPPDFFLVVDGKDVARILQEKDRQRKPPVGEIEGR